MVAARKALRSAFQELAERWNIIDKNEYLTVVWMLLQRVVGPVVLGLISLGLVYNTMRRIYNTWWNPPPVRMRYRHAVQLYQEGRVREALKAFQKLSSQDRYGLAVLSLAAHDIYVGKSPSEGLRRLREARMEGVSMPKRAMSAMQDDAKAMQEDGNDRMIEMNARMAKQEYLGITTP
jgi:hypothetical protein